MLENEVADLDTDASTAVLLSLNMEMISTELSKIASRFLYILNIHTVFF